MTDCARGTPGRLMADPLMLFPKPGWGMPRAAGTADVDDADIADVKDVGIADIDAADTCFDPVCAIVFTGPPTWRIVCGAAEWRLG